MAEREILDLDRLSVSVVPLRIALVISTMLGLFLGFLCISAAMFGAMSLVPLGIIAVIETLALTAAHVGEVGVIFMIAALAIPLGAALSAELKLKSFETFILRDCRAKPADPETPYGQAIAIMAQTAGLPEPPMHGFMDIENACAASNGRLRGLVLVGRPLLDMLTPAELFAVIGHEIGHIAMRDTQRKYLAIAHQEFLVSFLVFSGLKRLARTIFGLIGELALAAHSRRREYWADAVGAYVMSPEAMISALRALDDEHRPNAAERRYNALMFHPTASLFSSHPSFKKRIMALEQRTYLDRLPTRSFEPAAIPAEELPTAQRYEGI